MAQTDKLRKAKSLFSTTLSSGIGTGTGDTITLASTTGLPTDTEITLTFDRVDSDGNATDTSMERITGTISGSTLTSYTRGVDGSTEQAHSSGAVIEYIWNADDWNDAIDGFLVDHDQSGQHSDLTDANGNEWIKQTATASAVNEITVANAAASNAPAISCSGSDSNIDLSLAGKGTGGIVIPNTTSTTDGAIGFDTTNEDLAIGDGSAAQKVHMGAWKSYTPSLTNITQGNGTLSFKYSVVGKTVFVEGTFTMGSTSPVSGNMTFSLPVTAAISGQIYACDIGDYGTTNYLGHVYVNSTTTFVIRATTTSSTYAADGGTSATVPMTWAENDFVKVSFAYEAA